MTELEQETSRRATLICPACAGEVSTEPPYWRWQGRWYCQEKCVRDMMKRISDSRL